MNAQPPPKAKRPQCPACGRALTPRIKHVQERVDDERGFTMKTTSREWAGSYLGYGAFCTLRCCRVFANAAHTAGYRLKSTRR